MDRLVHAGVDSIKRRGDIVESLALSDDAAQASVSALSVVRCAANAVKRDVCVCKVKRETDSRRVGSELVRRRMRAICAISLGVNTKLSLVRSSFIG